jgi:hypothetical protein
MTEGSVVPFPEPGMERPPAAVFALRSNSLLAGSPERNQPVEIVMPDRHCADLLLEHAAPMVPAELVPVSAGWIVRLQPPPAGSGGWWMLEVLSLLDRWLESVPLPCAKVRYGGHSYLIRSSIETAQHNEAPRSVFAGAYALAHKHGI